MYENSEYDKKKKLSLVSFTNAIFENHILKKKTSIS